VRGDLRMSQPLTLGLVGRYRCEDSAKCACTVGEVPHEWVAVPHAVCDLGIVVTANARTAYRRLCSLGASTNRTGDAGIRSLGHQLEPALFDLFTCTGPSQTHGV
jgi:hypothetical protein